MDNETAPTSEPKPIRRLSENLINKIAAGEVRWLCYVCHVKKLIKLEL